MTAPVCPYCRTVIEPDSGNELLCAGCGTPHHADCYAENGGCTVFGCSAAPGEEQKLTLTGVDLSGTPPSASGNIPEMLPGVGLMPPGWTPNAPPKPVKAPPPPLPPGASAARAAEAAPAAIPVPRFGSGSVLFGSQPVAAVALAQAHTPTDFDDVPNPVAKNRMTFIVLGVLLGAFGAHNFYAGYRGKAIAQLCISLFSLGFASPMSWVWAVIDVWTVDRDNQGIKFKS
jgi:TM2 domain-containing membrane protein YozV